jgi:tRNA-specific 2-thiouridylase
MRLGLPGEEEKLSRIAHLARTLAVPWQAVDLCDPFARRVLKYFVDSYRKGLTPNPCILCNRHIKFGLLLAEMENKIPGGLFATGHYADKIQSNGRWFLREPSDRGKSQIYFLAMIEPSVLDRVIFPIAGLTVEQVRAKVAGLPLANARESQDVCFLQGEDLGVFLGRHIPHGFKAGDFLDAAGKPIGRHAGALHFTIGQRRGTGHASGRRLYVVGRDVAANTVTLGNETELLSESLAVKNPVFWRPLKAGETLVVKIRYERQGHEAEIAAVEKDRILAVFKRPVRAVTPGQFAVFYEGDIIVAAGAIAPV